MIETTSSLFKKYINNPLKILSIINRYSSMNEYIFYADALEMFNRLHLNRINPMKPNQFTSILNKLEKDGLIKRDYIHRPLKIFITNLGKRVLKDIVEELLYDSRINHE